jgi:hypothetical protein
VQRYIELEASQGVFGGGERGGGGRTASSAFESSFPTSIAARARNLRHRPLLAQVPQRSRGLTWWCLRRASLHPIR